MRERTIYDLRQPPLVDDPVDRAPAFKEPTGQIELGAGAREQNKSDERARDSREYPI